MSKVEHKAFNRVFGDETKNVGGKGFGRPSHAQLRTYKIKQKKK